jgi:hypothetical protein
MKHHHILETLALLATTSAFFTGCDKSGAQATEVPAGQGATPGAPATEECLHADGCCGGHTPGDATCGEDKAAPEAKSEDPPAKPEPAVAAWTKTWTVAPGDMAEINLELAAGDTMAAKFTSDGGTLKWNVHSHEGDKAVIHAQGNDAKGEPGHTAAKAGMYSFLWKNAGKKPVTLTIELELGGSAKVHSTHPAE